MECKDIIKIYNNLLDYLNEEHNYNFIWYKGIKKNAFLDNYFKFYLFKKGIEEGYYPMCNFTKKHTENKYILIKWNTFQEELNKVLPHNSERPKEFLLDIVWLDKTGQNMPFCMEMEQENNIDEILYDFKKLIFFKSNFKAMIFFGQKNMGILKNNLLCETFTIEENYLLISLDKVNIEKVGDGISKTNYSIEGKLLYIDSNGIFEKDLEDGAFSLNINSNNEVEKLS